ncbi:MAG: hypothetical protein OXG24_06580 [Gammaproteobacteria bacterium]|nr:hypothetical protein [Gammaproteobacteria bacterium]
MTQTGENYPPQESSDSKDTANHTLKIRVLPLAVLFIAVLTGTGLGTRFYVQQDLSVVYVILAVFFSTNIVICYWEACLFLRRDWIEKRTVYWRDRRIETGRLPHFEFFASKVPMARIFSPSLWADIWATYAQYDPSFADRRTYGFNVDISNGFFTFVPTLLLYATFTVYLFPSYVAGIIGLMLCWQWTYMTSVYWVSFFVANRHTQISRRDLYIYLFGMNAPWVLCPLLGLFVSIRLILDGNYSVLA